MWFTTTDIAPHHRHLDGYKSFFATKFWGDAASDAVAVPIAIVNIESSAGARVIFRRSFRLTYYMRGKPTNLSIKSSSFR